MQGNVTQEVTENNRERDFSELLSLTMNTGILLYFILFF